MSAPTTTQYDYIIAGGGIAGSVLARRLADKYPSSSILLVEAGGRPEGHPLIGPPMAAFAAHQSDLDWKYMSVPQKHLGGTPKYLTAGRFIQCARYLLGVGL
jgi:choline dehydrogenase-like flavoprotein